MQNIVSGEGVATISYVIGAPLFSKGVSELVYVDATYAHHLLKRWNNELITSFTIEVPKKYINFWLRYSIKVDESWLYWWL